MTAWVITHRHADGAKCTYEADAVNEIAALASVDPDQRSRAREDHGEIVAATAELAAVLSVSVDDERARS